MTEFVNLDLSTSMRECLALFEMWRTVGYSSDEIFISISEPLKDPEPVRGLTQVMMVLKWKSKEFSYNIAMVKEDKKEVAEAYRRAAEMWNNGTQRERSEILNSSNARRQAVMLLTKMAEKGFPVSKSAMRRN